MAVELPLCIEPESFTDDRRFSPWAESQVRFALQSGPCNAVLVT